MRTYKEEKQKIRKLESERKKLFSEYKNALFALAKHLLIFLEEQLTCFLDTGSSKPYTRIKLKVVTQLSEANEIHIPVSILENAITQIRTVNTDEDLMLLPLKVYEDFPFLLNYAIYLDILSTIKKLTTLYQSEAIFRDPNIPLF